MVPFALTLLAQLALVPQRLLGLLAQMDALGEVGANLGELGLERRDAGARPIIRLAQRVALSLELYDPCVRLPQGLAQLAEPGAKPELPRLLGRRR